MNDTVPVAAGQVRKGPFGVYWGVLRPHRRRKGFWWCASHEFPYDLIVAGRHQIEELPLSDLYADPHPGVDYWQTLEQAEEVSLR